MRITYAVPRYLPHLGGIENHVAALATRAVQRGHEVTVLTQQEGGDTPEAETIDGVAVRRYRSGLRMWGQGLSPAMWRAVRQARSGGIVHLHNVHAASTLGALAAVGHGRVLTTPHYLGVGEGTLNRALHRIYDPALARGLRNPSAIICVSHAEADELNRTLGTSLDRVHVIPNGVDLDLLQPPEWTERGEHTILVAGRLERYKQADVVIDALRFLPDSYSVAVAGAGPYLPALRDAAARTARKDQVQFLGKLNAQQLATRYGRSVLVVSMSRRECFGMTLAEAMAAGCSVVASDIPAHREVLESAGWDTDHLLPVDATPAEVALAVRRAVATHGSQRPKVTTWDDVADQTFSLYQTILASNGR